MNLLAWLKAGVSADELAALYGERTIREDVVLDGQEFEHPFVLTGFTFLGRFSAREARFRRGADLSGCTFRRGVVLDGARIDGSLLMNDVNARAILGYHEIDEPTAVALYQARVERSAELNRLTTVGTVLLGELSVGGQLLLLDPHLLGSLNAQSVKVGTGLYCLWEQAKKQPHVTGDIRLSSCQIGDVLWVVGLKVGGDFVLVNAVVEGNLFCRTRGQLQPAPPGKEGGPLDRAANRLVVGHAVSLDGATIRGGVSFCGANIGSKLVDGDHAFSAVRAEVDDGLHIGIAPDSASPQFRIRDRTRIHGPVKLSHVRVNAALSLVGVDTSHPVNLHDAHIDGDLLAGTDSEFPTTLGQVVANDLEVTGNLDLRGTSLACQPAGLDPDPCVDLRFATVRGECHQPGGSADTRRLHLEHASLGDLRFPAGGLPAIRADGLRFRLLTVPGADYVVFLAGTDPFHRSTYETVEDYLRERGEDGAANRVYREMRRRDRRQELDTVTGWLDGRLFGRSPHPLNPVRPPRWPRRAEVRWLRRRGLPAGLAVRLAALRRRAVWRLKRLAAWPFRFLYWLIFHALYDALIGYGSAPTRLGGILFVLWLVLTFGVFHTGLAVKRAFTPTAVELRDHPRLTEQEVRPADVGKVWRTTDAGAMAFRTVVPYTDLAVDADWQPSSDHSVFGYRSLPPEVSAEPAGGDGLAAAAGAVAGHALPERSHWWKDYTSVEVVTGLVRMFGYVAVPVFLVSVSGLLKRRGE